MVMGGYIVVMVQQSLAIEVGGLDVTVDGVSNISMLGIVLTLSTGAGGDGKSRRDAARLRSS